ncbi:MAG TPA: class I SAM-dependent methyltransferase [Puia sp.]|nr:class I SAM-dependent methyltransferase [Puia sp.]
MSNRILCPSCNSANISKASTVNANDIVALYKKNDIDTAELFERIPSVSLLHCIDCDLKFFNPPVPGNEHFYNQLQNKDWYFLHADKTEFSYSKTFVRDNDKVLDVGSGRGVWSKYIKEVPGTFYQGIEFSSKSIELAKQDGVNVIKESIEEHAGKLKDHYDIVAAFQVLEHIENVREFFAACVACTKLGGKLIIAVPNNEGFLKQMVNNWLNLPPHHINHWNERSLVKLGELFNLKVIDVHKEKVTPIHKLLFYNVRISSALSHSIGYRSRMVDHSLKFKILNKLSYWLARIKMPFSKTDLKSDGHTIIIVYEK